MSKDVVIAGFIVLACLVLVVAALSLPSKTPKPAETTEFAANPDSSSGPGLPGDVGPGSVATDPFGSPGGFGTGTNSGGGFGSNNVPGFGNSTGSPTGGFGQSPGSFGSIGNGPKTGSGGSVPITGGGSPIGFPVAPVNSGLTPPMAETLVVPVAGGDQTHVVAKNETLMDISMKYYGTSRHWQKIRDTNKVDPLALKEGTKLSIPEIAAPVAVGPGETAGPGENTYKIKKDDTYYSIAKHELGSAARWKEIEKLNKLAPEDLRSGMTITLPAKANKDHVAPVTVTGESNDAALPVSSGKVHVVAANETLMDISRKHYGTTTKWREIAKANPGLDPVGMKVGQKVSIPEIAGVPAPGSSPVTETATPSVGSEYVVKPNDTLDSIAQRQLGKKSDAKKIQEANPGVNPLKLRVGQKLMIPGKAGELPPPAPTTSFPTTSSTSGFPAPGPTGFSGSGSAMPSGPSTFGSPMSTSPMAGAPVDPWALPKTNRPAGATTP